MNRQQRDAMDARMITVCSACLRASCWQGKLYCDRAKEAGTARMPARTLRKLLLEAPVYWESDQPDGPAADRQHANQERREEDQPAQFGKLAGKVSEPAGRSEDHGRDDVNQRANDSEDNAFGSDHEGTPNPRSVPDRGRP
jgi:hypothetical protein